MTKDQAKDFIDNYHGDLIVKGRIIIDPYLNKQWNVEL